jgi:hypothetical protein
VNAFAEVSESKMQRIVADLATAYDKGISAYFGGRVILLKCALIHSLYQFFFSRLMFEQC